MVDRIRRESLKFLFTCPRIVVIAVDSAILVYLYSDSMEPEQGDPSRYIPNQTISLSLVLVSKSLSSAHQPQCSSQQNLSYEVQNLRFHSLTSRHAMTHTGSFIDAVTATKRLLHTIPGESRVVELGGWITDRKMRFLRTKIFCTAFP